MEALQIYWWFVISLLGGLLVWLLFVQGGQTLIITERDPQRKTLMVNALGRKWELTFTTLVVFGGAFFASFPLYYSTSFGGAYWLWMLILLSFILQAVSYEFRSKPGNVFGTTTYDAFLWFNGSVGCIMLGCAVAMQFFGADFSVGRANILNPGAPVISTWASTHGLEVMCSLPNLVLGFMVLFLARTTGALFFIGNINDGNRQGDFRSRMRATVLRSGTVFVLLFLTFAYLLLTADGYTTAPDGQVVAVPYKYALNLMELWWIGAAFVVGVLLVLYGIVRTVFDRGFNAGFWFTGVGTVVVVTSLLCICGYNNTAFLPSVSDPQSSLTLANASSSAFTLRVMAWVTVLLPVVIGYIAYVWHKMTAPGISADELSRDSHKY